MTDEGQDFTYDLVETSAGAYLVTGKDRLGRSVTLRGTDPDALRSDCRSWLQSQTLPHEHECRVGTLWHLFRKRAWLEGDSLVTRIGRREARLPLTEVTGLRFVSSPWDTGSVILHSAHTEIELEGVGLTTRALRFALGRRLRELGQVPTSWQHRWAWKRLGVRVERRPRRG